MCRHMELVYRHIVLVCIYMALVCGCMTILCTFMAHCLSRSQGVSVENSVNSAAYRLPSRVPSSCALALNVDKSDNEHASSGSLGAILVT